MIKFIEEKIRNKLLPNEDCNSDISFLKLNTPISGNGLGNKVLFMVFIDSKTYPYVVVKTVRSMTDHEVIRKSFSNLVKLNRLTQNTDFFDMFPKALMIEDVADNCWSVESFCTGHKPNMRTDFGSIFDWYCSLSKLIHLQSKATLIIDSTHAKKIINQFTGSKEIISTLNSYVDKLFDSGPIEIPAIQQHGDFTIDNILIDGDKIRVIDCDLFGNIVVPGYDIFHIIVRNNDITKKETYLKKYFDTLEIEAVLDKRILFVYFLHDLDIKRDYILAKETPASIIEKFELMVASF